MSKTVKAVIGIVLAAVIALLGADVTIHLTHTGEGELTTKIEVVDSNAIVEEAETPEPVEIEENKTNPQQKTAPPLGDAVNW